MGVDLFYSLVFPAGLDLLRSPTANSDSLSTDGSQDDDTQSLDGGLETVEHQDGMTTTTVESLPTGPGDYTITTTNPDQTKTLDTYTDDLLTQEQQLGTTGAVITTTGYTYNAMRELATETDSTGTTHYTYYQDGTQDTQADPGQNPTTDDTPYPVAGQPQTTTLPDGNTQTLIYDYQHNLISQGGAGQLAATYGYDENGTGQLTSLTTSTGTTHWAYDPATAQLLSETFADGTKDVYKYNDKGQLSSELLPGVTGTFGYDAAGDQLRSTYIDATTGLVQSIVAQQDDQGRAIATISTDNGKSFTETDAYTSLGDVQSDTFGSAGNTSVAYGYYTANTAAGHLGGDSDALASVTASTPGGRSVSQSYTYDSSGRLASITVNGVTLIYSYVNGSNQIGGISAEASGGNGLNLGVSETFTPDGADGSRLGEISVDTTTDAGHGNTNQQAVYDASYTYNTDNQRQTDVVTQTDSDGNTTTQTLNYTYDPALADALTQVTDGSGNVRYNYGYDGTGNFTGNASLGGVNSVNEYSNLTYNSRHDLTNDGTDTFGYDALDRLISVTPNSPSTDSLSAQYGYDSQGRMTWENVYTWAGSWTLSTTYHFVWSGSELIEKLDGNNNALQQYTWGPGENGTDQVLLLTNYSGGSGTTYELTYDASGDVAMIENPATGIVVANYTYTPYGALISATGPEAAINPILEKGYWTDLAVDPNLAWAGPSTGYATDRVVDPVLAVWLQSDPSGTSGGINPTEFDSDDPVNNSDPNGLSAVPATQPSAQRLEAYHQRNSTGSIAMNPFAPPLPAPGLAAAAAIGAGAASAPADISSGEVATEAAEGYLGDLFIWPALLALGDAVMYQYQDQLPIVPASIQGASFPDEPYFVFPQQYYASQNATQSHSNATPQNAALGQPSSNRSTTQPSVPNPNGRNGTPAHQADVAANNSQQSGELRPQKVGNRVPDGVGQQGQVVTIRGQRIDPGPNGRVIVESEPFTKGSLPISDGRRQLIDIRNADPGATIVVTDPDDPTAPPLVYPPGTQPAPGGRLAPGTPPSRRHP